MARPHFHHRMSDNLAEFKRVCHTSDAPPSDAVISSLLQTHHPLDVMCQWYDSRQRDRHIQLADRLCDLRVEGIDRTGRSDSLPPYVQLRFIERGLIAADDDDWVLMFRRAEDMVAVYQKLNLSPDAQVYADATALMNRMLELDPVVADNCTNQFGPLTDMTQHFGPHADLTRAHNMALYSEIA